MLAFLFLYWIKTDSFATVLLLLRLLLSASECRSFILPNVKDEPRPWLARLVLLGARGVTAKVVGSSDWFGSWFVEWKIGFIRCHFEPHQILKDIESESFIYYGGAYLSD